MSLGRLDSWSLCFSPYTFPRIFIIVAVLVEIPFSSLWPFAPQYPAIASHPFSRPEQIRLACYNIQSGRQGRLESALRASYALYAMDQMNVDVGILTEAKLTEGIYTRRSSGYTVVATRAVSYNQGGVALLYRENNVGFTVESVAATHGPNVLRFILRYGAQPVAVVECYCPPSDNNAELENIALALAACPQGIPKVVLGDLNADLGSLGRHRDVESATLMGAHDLADILPFFKNRQHEWSAAVTWQQHRHNFVVSSRCDYILASDPGIFSNCQILEPSLFCSDHRLVLEVIRGAPEREQRANLEGRDRFPLRLPK